MRMFGGPARMPANKAAPDFRKLLPSETQLKFLPMTPLAPRRAVKDAYRAAQITQAQAAKMLGLSLPHLSNALAGRYPLSGEIRAGTGEAVRSTNSHSV